MQRIRVEKPKARRRSVQEDGVDTEAVVLSVRRATAGREELLEKIDALLDELDRAVELQR